MKKEFKSQKLKIGNKRAINGKRIFSRSFAFHFAASVCFCGLIFLSCAAAEVAAQKTRSISAVQGDSNMSPFQREHVRVSGVVTARLKSGFFIQTPDDKTDDDPRTSEGVYVFTRTEPAGEATVGNLVSVTGTIEEFRPKQEPLSLPITEISMEKGKDFLAVESKNNRLPKPIVLSVDDFKNNRIDALEKYEGMRVGVPEMTAVAPTGGRVDEKTGASESDGTFYGVVRGLPRPLREPGLDVYDYALLSDKEKEKIKADYPKISIFDHNPERSTLR